MKEDVNKMEVKGEEDKRKEEKGWKTEEIQKEVRTRMRMQWK